MSGSVVLTTVQFGFPTLTISDTQAYGSLEEKVGHELVCCNSDAEMDITIE